MSERAKKPRETDDNRLPMISFRADEPTMKIIEEFMQDLHGVPESRRRSIAIRTALQLAGEVRRKQG